MANGRFSSPKMKACTANPGYQLENSRTVDPSGVELDLAVEARLRELDITKRPRHI